MSLSVVLRDLKGHTPPPSPAPLPRRRWWENLITVHAPVDTPEQLLEQHEGEWTPAEVLALITWLPDDSATAASLQGGREYLGWGQDRWMRKSTFDAIQTGTVVNMKIAAGKKHGRIKMAEPWPTPDEQKRKIERSRPRVTVASLPKLQLPSI